MNNFIAIKSDFFLTYQDHKLLNDYLFIRNFKTEV